MSSLRIITIVGARPQFIKAAAVSRAIAQHNAAGSGPQIEELIVHTGQHYDDNMSKVFFDELNIPRPAVNLEVGSGPHGQQTGLMLGRLEQALMGQRPDWVLVYGDTNSTLAGALAAAKLNIPIAHVEAGLRSFNRRMPEEINRVVVDHLATLFFCPTETAVRSLANEGIVRGVHQVGDVMHDSVLFNANLAEERSSIVARLGLEPKSYCLATVHRAENTDEPQRLASILDAFRQLDHPVVLPMHPRTRKTLGAGLDQIGGRIRVIDPLSYLDMLMLERNARIILTDSGGVQKEAYWLAVPCVTLRDETEWVELVDAGWNTIAGAESEAILEAVGRFEAGGPVARKDPPDGLYGNGRSGERIVGVMIDVAGPSATASTWRDTKGKQVSCAEHPPARSSNRAASRLSFIP